MAQGLFVFACITPGQQMARPHQNLVLGHVVGASLADFAVNVAGVLVSSDRSSAYLAIPGDISGVISGQRVSVEDRSVPFVSVFESVLLAEIPRIWGGNSIVWRKGLESRPSLEALQLHLQAAAESVVISEAEGFDAEADAPPPQKPSCPKSIGSPTRMQIPWAAGPTWKIGASVQRLRPQLRRMLRACRRPKAPHST